MRRKLPGSYAAAAAGGAETAGGSKVAAVAVVAAVAISYALFAWLILRDCQVTMDRADDSCERVQCRSVLYYALPYPYCTLVVPEYATTAQFNETHVRIGNYTCTPPASVCMYSGEPLANWLSNGSVTPRFC